MREKLSESDVPLVGRHARKVLRDRVLDTKFALHLQFQDRRRREDLGDRADIEDRVPRVGPRTPVVCVAVTLLQDHLTMSLDEHGAGEAERSISGQVKIELRLEQGVGRRFDSGRCA